METFLNLRSQRLTDIPKLVFTNPQLKYLDANYNLLRCVPSDIGNLLNLQTLHLCGNQIVNIDPSITKLTNLQSLNLDENNLMVVPDCITNITTLQRLGLSRNKLQGIPESISNLSGLKVLYLQNNMLSSLPESIGELINLTFLYIDNNRLKTFPKTLQNLHNLELISCKVNPLVFPPFTSRMSNLVALLIDDNQMTTICHNDPIMDYCITIPRLALNYYSSIEYFCKGRKRMKFLSKVHTCIPINSTFFCNWLPDSLLSMVNLYTINLYKINRIFTE